MPGVRKAELIEGVVHMPSPVKISQHSQPHGRLVTWLFVYSDTVKKTEAGDNGTVLLDFDNEYQPDVFLRIRPECGGQSRTTEDDYVEGAPEMAVEVASSSASYDVHTKKTAYRRNGVREYLVWLTRENRLIWWQLVDGEYVEIQPDAEGLLKSSVFPGLWLDAEAMLQGDLARVLSVLNTGLATSESQSFRQ
jgi:Uma2 family endonuclease